MRISTKLALLFVIAVPFAGLVGAGCSGGGTSAPDGGGGKGGAGTGAAGAGAAGTGGAGAGAAGTGGAGMAGSDAAAGTGAAGASTDGGADTSSPDVAADTSTSDTAADTSADVAAEASTSDVATETSASDATIACVTITLPAPVFAHYLTTAAPAPAGGTIVEGTYSLTELNHYGSAAASTGNDPIRSAIKFAGNTIEWANQAKQEPASGGSFTYVTATNALTLTKVCPTAGAGGGPGYTATATTFKLYLDAEYVYTKQ